MIRQAVILAGGKGTRLGAITQAIPKPMLPIAGDRPFLDYLLEMIERHGYEDILLLGGYLGDVLEAAYDGRRIGGATIRVMLEKAPLGTAGALTIARDALDPRFLMMNGDAFFDINLRALEQASHESGAMATLALRSVENAARYGRVIADHGKVVAFLEKDANRPNPGIINGGVYVLKREMLDLVDALPCSLEQDVFPALVKRGQIRGKEFEGYFLDIGLPETLEQGHRELPKARMRPAAIFDRDTLVKLADEGPESLQWTKGAVEAIRTLNDRGYFVVIAGNPSGGAQAPGGACDLSRLKAAMQERLAAEGAHIDRFCRELGDAPPDRLFEGLQPIVGERSFWIGVSAANLEAARSAGITLYVIDGRDLAQIVHAGLTQVAVGAEEGELPTKRNRPMSGP